METPPVLLPAADLSSGSPIPERAKLSSQLDVMADGLTDRPISFGEMIEVTQGRAYDLLLILLAVPFLSPIGAIPGVSAFMGIVMTIIGYRLALGQKPWLPQRILSRKLGQGVVVRILRAGASVMRRMEKLLRPRFGIFHDAVFFQRCAGALIAISGFLLFLPILMPLSNFMPAFTVMLLAAAALERDGAFFIAGVVMFLITCAFFTAVALGGMEVLQWVRDLLPAWGSDPDVQLLPQLPPVP